VLLLLKHSQIIMHNVVRQIKNLLNCIMVELEEYLLMVMVKLVILERMVNMVQMVINCIN